MGYSYTKRDNKKRLLSERPNNRTFREVAFSKWDVNIEKKIAETSKKRDEKIRVFDERYSVIVKLFMSEIEKRKIDITAPEFNEKMDEILQEISKGKFFQTRYSTDNMDDIRNTILRRVNSERRKGALKEER